MVVELQAPKRTIAETVHAHMIAWAEAQEAAERLTQEAKESRDRARQLEHEAEHHQGRADSLQATINAPDFLRQLLAAHRSGQTNGSH